MALQVECPQCYQLNSLKRKTCGRCDFKLSSLSSRTYYIDYTVDGRRKREKIGPSKRAAEHRLREIKTQLTEDRFIQKNKNAETSLRQVIEWYLNLTEVKQKRSFDCIKLYLQNILKRIDGSMTLNRLEISHVEQYKSQRLAEKNPKTGKPIQPSTVNRDLTNLKACLNKAAKYGRIDLNPVASMQLLEEDNVRERVLTNEEFKRLFDCTADYLKPAVLMAYTMPMRQSEILKLTWNEVDIDRGFIRLGGKRTKNKTGRNIPIHPDVLELLRVLPSRFLRRRVFLKEGKPFEKCHKGFKRAVQKAALGDFTFHDLRHCSINNLRLMGNDHYAIKAASGHKTDSAFKRYNLVTEEELSRLKFPEIGMNDRDSDREVIGSNV